MRTVEERITEAREIIAAQRPGRPRGLLTPDGPNGLRTVVSLLLGRRSPLDVFSGMHRSHQPIGFVTLARDHVYVLADPEVIWEAYVNRSHHLMKHRGLQLTRPVLGNGLLTSERAVHKRNRRLVQPEFHRAHIAGYADDMAAAAQTLDARWARITAPTGSARVSVTEQMSALTLDVVGQSLFGTDLTGDADEVGAAFDEVMLMWDRLLGPLSPGLSRVPNPTRTRYIAATRRLDDVIARLIVEKRAALAAGRAGNDVLSKLLQTRDEDTGEYLTDDEVRDETMTLVLAGHETTAMLLAWTWRDLTLHPELRGWVREELDVLDGPPTLADLAQLPRTRALLTESMRLHPPAWAMGRAVVEDFELAGYRIPAGSLLFVLPYAMQRDERFWPEPEEFDPQRWLDHDGAFSEKNPGLPRGVWFPFGFAGRRCIGEQFAWMEAVLVLGSLLKNWDVDVIEPEKTEAMSAITLRPIGGLPGVVRRRVAR